MNGISFAAVDENREKVKKNDQKSNLTKLPFWDKLTEEEKIIAADNTTLQKYDKDEFVHGGGSDCLGMIYVQSGELRAYILSEEGREITLFHIREGEICVLAASCVIGQLTFDTFISVEKATEILVINSGAFSHLTERNIYVRCFMFELLAERFSTVMWVMQEILFKGFDRRLASFLVSEYDRTGEREIRITHEKIAQHTNSAREVVARMLKRFSSEGVVEVKRGVIIIKSIDELRELL